MTDTSVVPDKKAGPSGMMKCVEKYRAEIVVCIVLPISLLIWLFKKLTRFLTYPSAALHDERVQRVSADVKASREQGKPLRTDRSVFNSHSGKFRGVK
jgi:hypothetical protein